MVDEVRVASKFPDLFTPIASPAPNGSLGIRLPDFVKPGPCYLKGLNGRGEFAA
jgi:hypothetical protein